MKTRMRDSISNRNALLHMIGQLHDMNKWVILTGELQAIMGLSKPTTIKRLNELAEIGFLQKEIASYRNHADCFVWCLTKRTYEKYCNGIYEQDYKFFLTCRNQLASMKPHNKVMSI